MVVRFSGDSGDGMQLAGNIFSNISATVGNDISTFPDYPADIRAPQGSLTGVSGFQVHIGAGKVFTPGDKCDVLVVDKIGKNISGDGMDPNVSGRFVQPKYCSGGIQAEKCVILDLTDETHGNAQGIGLAEVTTRRLFNKMKLEMTYPTGVTNTFLHLMKIPMIMANDREALQLALMCCPEAEDHDHMKMIRIPNTAHIGVIEISEGMLPLVENNPNFEVLTEPYDLPFDENGNLF